MFLGPVFLGKEAGYGGKRIASIGLCVRGRDDK
jgi:hypothetical protein